MSISKHEGNESTMEPTYLAWKPRIDSCWESKNLEIFLQVRCDSIDVCSSNKRQRHGKDIQWRRSSLKTIPGSDQKSSVISRGLDALVFATIFTLFWHPQRICDRFSRTRATKSKILNIEALFLSKFYFIYAWYYSSFLILLFILIQKRHWLLSSSNRLRSVLF